MRKDDTGFKEAKRDLIKRNGSSSFQAQAQRAAEMVQCCPGPFNLAQEVRAALALEISAGIYSSREM